MIFVFLILLASIMAAFGIIGYLRGTRPMVLSLVIFLMVVVLVEIRSEELITLLNGMYIGVMLVLKSGLNDIASGNLDSAAAKLEDIQRPFVGTTANLGLLLIVLMGVLFSLLIGLLIKKRKPSVIGAILGIVYGYLVAAAILPLLGLPAGLLPIPFLRPFDPTMPEPSATPDTAAEDTGGLLETLAQPGTASMIALVIMVSMAAILLLSVRRGSKSGKRG